MKKCVVLKQNMTDIYSPGYLKVQLWRDACIVEHRNSIVTIEVNDKPLVRRKVLVHLSEGQICEEVLQ